MPLYPVKNIYKTKNVRFNDGADDSLLVSMHEHGQLQPILAYQVSGGLAIKDGHRRFEAAKKLGWDVLDVDLIAPPADDAQLLIHQIHINEQRNGLSYLEKARAYQTLKEVHTWTQSRIAAECGTDDASVCLALKLLKATPIIQDAVEMGRISPSAIEPLLSLPPEKQASLASAAIKARTVRAVKALVDADKRLDSLTVDSDNFDAESILDDADPLEQIALTELEMALEHIKSASQAEITHPQLAQDFQRLVTQLVTLANSLHQSLNGLPTAK